MKPVKSTLNLLHHFPRIPGGLLALFALTCAGLACLGLSCPASANTETGALGLRYSYGVGRFSGDLGDTTARPVHDFQLSFLQVRAPESSFHGFLAIDVLATSAVHRGSSFPFPSGSALDVLAFLFIPHLCSTHLSPATLCLGLGQGTVNVNAERDRRDFGSWNYQFLAELPIQGRWSAHFIGKYIGQVEQTVDGVYSKFGLYTAAVGVGWR